MQTRPVLLYRVLKSPISTRPTDLKDEKICEHLGWYSKAMCRYYTSREVTVQEALVLAAGAEGTSFGDTLSVWCTPQNRVFV